MEYVLKIVNKEVITSLVIILVGIVSYFISSKIISKIIDKSSANNKRRETYIKLLGNILKYVILFVVVITVLQINGINVTSIIAGLGVVSVVAGLALQDALKDIIMGFNIILDGYFSVGDILKINGMYAKVVELGIKSTKLKDIANGNLYVIANRNISDALTISDQLDIDVPVSYSAKIVDVERVFDGIVKKISQIEGVNEVSYKGLNEFADSAIIYKIRIQAKPELQPQIKRDSNRIIKIDLDKNDIEIPFMQVDIHTR